MKTRLEQPIKIGSAQLDRLALMEDTTGGSTSPKGYQKPTRRENMMYSNTKFIEQEAQQQQVINHPLTLSTKYNFTEAEAGRINGRQCTSGGENYLSLLYIPLFRCGTNRC